MQICMRGYFYTMKKGLIYLMFLLLAVLLSDWLYRRIILDLYNPAIVSWKTTRGENIIAETAKTISIYRDVDYGIYQAQPKHQPFQSKHLDRYVKVSDTYLGSVSENVVKQWNKNFVSRVTSNGVQDYYFVMIEGYGDSCPVYTPYDTSIFPVYRFTPNSRVPSSTMAFNDFGWTGSDISIQKPEKTIRIAFVGGSTTQLTSPCSFSYTDFVGAFLNQWAETTRNDVYFETINTGRVALRSMDFAAIVKYELLPVEPDIVVYYEGRNQFGLQPLVGYNHYDDDNKPWMYKLFSRSAWLQLIARNSNYDLLKQIEQSKPHQVIKLDEHVNEDNPNPYNSKLPISLPQIVSDLDEIRENLDSINSELVICSFAMVLNDSLFNTGTENASIYSYWIHDYGNIRLKEIGRLNKLENRVFENYAARHQLPYLDVATDLTGTPEAFIDGIHLSCDGMKLHGWSVFSQLLPIIEKKIENGQLPRSSQHQRTEHPYIHDDWSLVPMPEP